jgi:hypothetical protein
VKLLARASAGLILWALGFVWLYTLHGLGCAREWNAVALAGGSLFRWVLVVSWVLLGAAAVALILWAKRLPVGFEGRLATTSAFAGAVGVVVTGMPVTLTSVCV